MYEHDPEATTNTPTTTSGSICSSYNCSNNKKKNVYAYDLGADRLPRPQRRSSRSRGTALAGIRIKATG